MIVKRKKRTLCSQIILHFYIRHFTVHILRIQKKSLAIKIRITLNSPLIFSRTNTFANKKNLVVIPTISTILRCKTIIKYPTLRVMIPTTHSRSHAGFHTGSSKYPPWWLNEINIIILLLCTVEGSTYYL